MALAPGAQQPGLPSEQRLSRVFYSDNGSTAVEVAIKMAAQYWAQNGRPARTRFVTLSGAFHGETVGATSVGGVPLFREVFGPLLFDVVHVPSPAEEGGWERAFAQVERVLREEGDTVAGVILEPVVQGAAGMQVYAPGFVRAVREATRAVDTFLIADEVFTGLGRTGARFACDLAEVVPDLLCLAKALSGGLLPFGATLATERVFSGFLGARERALYYGHSYCGNPLGAAVAREVLAVYRDEDVLGQVARNGAEGEGGLRADGATRCRGWCARGPWAWWARWTWAAVATWPTEAGACTRRRGGEGSTCGRWATRCTSPPRSTFPRRRWTNCSTE